MGLHMETSSFEEQVFIKKEWKLSLWVFKFTFFTQGESRYEAIFDLNRLQNWGKTSMISQ